MSASTRAEPPGVIPEKRVKALAAVVILQRGPAEGDSPLSPAELNALACARALCGQGGFAVAGVGATRAALREAASFGAGRALLLPDGQGRPAYQAAEEVAEAIRQAGFRLALCADRGPAGEGGLFSSCLAGVLGWEVVHGAYALGAEGDGLAIERAAGGLREVIRTDAPAVVTLGPGAGEPRAPLAGVLHAANIDIEVIRAPVGAEQPAPRPLRLQVAAPAHAIEPPAGATVRERVAAMSGRASASAPEPEVIDPHQAAAEILAAIRAALGGEADAG
ncbi:MAG: hypothetical protein M0000_11475 [Actinomycetota bacterium]|nr:hypothetical protein [Actinomycetota bacterium]